VNGDAPYLDTISGFGVTSGLLGTANDGQTKQPQKRQCSDIERLSKVWGGIETMGDVGLGAGLAITGAIGGVAACTAGEVASPLLCVAASPGAVAAEFVGYRMMTSAWKELQKPNNPEFGADCQ
jgi:hypothetical protein